jgi:hypothetical protein
MVSIQILISAVANGLSCFAISVVPVLVNLRCLPEKAIESGGLVLYEGLEENLANFRSKEEETGGEVAVGEDNCILGIPPAIGMLPDMVVRRKAEITCFQKKRLSYIYVFII